MQYCISHNSDIYTIVCKYQIENAQSPIDSLRNKAVGYSAFHTLNFKSISECSEEVLVLVNILKKNKIDFIWKLLIYCNDDIYKILSAEKKNKEEIEYLLIVLNELLWERGLALADVSENNENEKSSFIYVTDSSSKMTLKISDIFLTIEELGWFIPVRQRSNLFKIIDRKTIFWKLLVLSEDEIMERFNIGQKRFEKVKESLFFVDIPLGIKIYLKVPKEADIKYFLFPNLKNLF